MLREEDCVSGPQGTAGCPLRGVAQVPWHLVSDPAPSHKSLQSLSVADSRLKARTSISVNAKPRWTSAGT